MVKIQVPQKGVTTVNTNNVWDRIVSLENNVANLPTEMNISGINTSITNINASLADLASQNNYSVFPTYTNGQLTKVEEKDGTTVKNSSTLTYNSDGTVNTITEVFNEKTVVTTLNYLNGEFTSISRAVL